MVTYDAIDRHTVNHRPGQERYLSSLALCFPCNEAMLDGVAERGGEA